MHRCFLTLLISISFPFDYSRIRLHQQFWISIWILSPIWYESPKPCAILSISWLFHSIRGNYLNVSHHTVRHPLHWNWISISIFSIAFSKRIKWHCWDDNENFIYIYVYICVFCVDMTFNTKCTHSYIKISAFYLDCIHEKGRAVLKKVNELIIFSSFFRKLLVVMASNL